MKEGLNSERELPHRGERLETQEDPRSPEEVAEIVTEESEDFVAKGEDQYEELMYGLSESDPKVVSFREHLSNIAARAKEIPKWAAASLALAMAQPATAQESAPQSVLTQETSEQTSEEIVVTASAKPYKLERNNPQREGYTTPEGYRKYLDDAWETLREPYLPPPELTLDIMAENVYGKKFEDLTPEERLGVELRFTQKPRWDENRRQHLEILNDVEGSIKPAFDQARNLSDAEIEKQSNEYQEAFRNLDDQREWLAGVVHSPEYRRRLRINEKIDEVRVDEDEDYDLHEGTRSERYGFDKRYEGMPTDPVERRKYRVTQDVLRVSDIQHPLEEGALGQWYSEDTETDNNNFPGRAVIDKTEAINPESTTGLHELAHHVTEGEKRVSPAAKWLYGRAYNSELIAQKYPGNPEYVEYFSRPDELDAYKREFEYDLEKLTDWKYGETVTPELIEQVQKLRKEGELNDGSERFLDSIKPGYLMRVMNTLAENDLDQRVDGKSHEERV